MVPLEYRARRQRCQVPLSTDRNLKPMAYCGTTGSRGSRSFQWTRELLSAAGPTQAVAHALLAFVIFCVLSGAAYAANDVLDVEEDRKHPLKRFRPVASGEISVRAALAFAAVLAAGALVLSFTLLPYGVGIAGVAYLVLQVFYTTILKHAAILDVMSISAGFVIRALAGVAAVSSPISPWLI